MHNKRPSPWSSSDTYVLCPQGAPVCTINAPHLGVAVTPVSACPQHISKHAGLGLESLVCLLHTLVPPLLVDEGLGGGELFGQLLHLLVVRETLGVVRVQLQALSDLSVGTRNVVGDLQLVVLTSSSK